MPTLAEMNYSLEPIQPLRIHYLRQSGYMAMPRYHAHHCYELFYVQSGERQYVINNDMYCASAGDLVLIRPDDVHRTVSTQALQCERILVHFGEDFVMQGSGLQFSLMELGQYPIFSLPLSERKQVEQCLQTLLSEMQLKKPGYIEWSRCLLVTLLIVLHRVRTNEQKLLHSRDTVATCQAASSHHPMESQMDEIVNYMRQHYHTALSLHQIARQFYISPAYLCRIFPRITGLHFRAFLQCIRLQEACRLLSESHLDIGLIAERVGYAHMSNFSVTFKKSMGCTPTEYRRQKQSNIHE